MEKDILEFGKQFLYAPEVANADGLHPFSRAVLIGMGGSHLAADILKDIAPMLPLTVHKDYGLPALSGDSIKQTLFIASSYSGNTEEVVDAASIAAKNNYNLVCIAQGGKLLSFAKENKIPYIALPESSVQPRLALGFSSLALLAALGHISLLEEFRQLERIDAEVLRKEGEEIGASLEGKIPVIYTSSSYRSVGYNWKIKFNETSKVPAFANIFPELNHNEMQGFGRGKGASDFSFIILSGPDDDSRIRNRMEITKELLEEKGFTAVIRDMQGVSKSERIFNTLILGDWASVALASRAGIAPDAVPMIASFKEKLRNRE